jgi:hypothetical protein
MEERNFVNIYYLGGLNMGHEYSLSDIAAANGGMGNEMWNNPQ